MDLSFSERPRRSGDVSELNVVVEFASRIDSKVQEYLEVCFAIVMRLPAYFTSSDNHVYQLTGKALDSLRA